MIVGQKHDPPDDDLPPSREEQGQLDEPLLRPLSEYSIEAIMDELALRFPAFVFYAELDRHDDATGGYRRYHGRFPLIVGLVTMAAWDLQNA